MAYWPERGHPLEEQLQWPKINNIISTNSIKEVIDALKNNKTVTVTEKLDGSNICISSDGWVASRRVIINDCIDCTDLPRHSFNKIPLTKLALITEPLAEINSDLEDDLKTDKIQLLLYGEWLQKGTATTQEDKYNYKEDLEIGYPYIFGLAVRFEERTEEERVQTDSILEEKFGPILQSSLGCCMIGMNKKLCDFLGKKDILTVPLVDVTSIEKALTNDENKERVSSRKIEGFVFTAKNFIIKWKAYDEENIFQRETLEILKNELMLAQSDSTEACIQSLEEVCFSKCPASTRPTKRLTKRLLMRSYRSADTKYPRIEDLCRECGESADFENEKQEALTNLKTEMEKDLQEQGYILDKTDSQEIKSLVSSILNRRVFNFKKSIRNIDTNTNINYTQID